MLFLMKIFRIQITLSQAIKLLKKKRRQHLLNEGHCALLKENFNLH